MFFISETFETIREIKKRCTSDDMIFIKMATFVLNCRYIIWANEQRRDTVGQISNRLARLSREVRDSMVHVSDNLLIKFC